jgi:hypothetical protein
MGSGIGQFDYKILNYPKKISFFQVLRFRRKESLWGVERINLL